MTAAPMTTPTPPDNLHAALTYARRGWRVVPVPPGSKVPTITAWQKEGTTDEARIRHWWTTAPDHGIGIVCGEASGLWVLDVDVAGDKAGDETLAELIDAHGPLPDTYEVVTGSGGRHIYLKWPQGQIIRNSASGALGPGLDVRGEGGFVVAPPSLHASGRRYEVEASAPTHIAPAPAWLLGLLAARDEPTRREAVAPRSDRPGDRWMASTSWDDLLGRDGWVKLRPGPGGEDRWVRPGKDPREGPSATVGYGGSDVLKVFTSSHPTLQAEHTYTKLGYIAFTRHGGDFTAARAWCEEQGFPAEQWDVRDLVGDPVATSDPDAPWPDPKPWKEQATLPDFPLEVLPEWAVEHIVAASEARQVPVDLCATLAIGALSAAATGRAVVHLNDEWTEPVNLYLVCAMRSGAGKSPAEKAVVGWLRRWERERVAACHAANEEAAIAAAHAAKVVQRLSGKETATVDEILAANTRLKDAEAALIPVPRLIIDDATPEAVATMLAAHGERLAVLSTEADLFDSLLRGTPAQRPNMNVYLKAWSGDELRRDRKGGSDTGPETTILTKPLLTVSVTVQPSVLARLLTDAEMVGRGFAARFMVSAPADLMGRRDQRRRFRAGASGTTKAFEAHAAALADRWATWMHPADLRLSEAAARRFEDFLVEMEPSLGIGADMESLAEWAAKLQGSVARYAGLLHIAEGCDTAAPVDEATMVRAIALGRYWIAHAIAVAGSAEDDTTTAARILLEWIAASGRPEVTLRDMQRGVRRPSIGLDSVTDYIAPVELLIDHGWLRPVDKRDWRAGVGVKGSPSPRFQILPSVVGASPEALVVRVVRCRPMGERESLPITTDTHTPQAHALLTTPTTSEPTHDPLDLESLLPEPEEGNP